MDLRTAIAKLMRTDNGEKPLRFVAGNAELIEETRETIEIERLFRKAIMDA